MRVWPKCSLPTGKALAYGMVGGAMLCKSERRPIISLRRKPQEGFARAASGLGALPPSAKRPPPEYFRQEETQALCMSRKKRSG
ncbi:hypothetical protein TRP8649_04343 [Pelagimonas phthalicica]|uniref:Uncharacterized protein n=1 Tax=Pelagimonas phthalicica TaxID=1037362 RepID=A0A238JHQ5_9RHOB|nr:hypothetical protein CLV87_4089 [Pelagimonas phthalicica]SMX30201.1 hypothetical protein TRP8649_04343 [Pelagimonas phthalicica]